MVKNKHTTSVFHLLVLLILLSSCTVYTNKSELNESDLIQLADEYYANSEYDTSIQCYNEALNINYDNPLTHYKIGIVYGSLHSLGYEPEGAESKKTRVSRSVYPQDSYFMKAKHHFEVAAELGHLPSRELLRTLYRNIQHRDIKY